MAGGGGDDDASERAKRSARRRARVTLKWNAVPLALPGESSGEEELESVELALPHLDSGDAEDRPSSIPPAGEGTGFDGWERQADRRTPPPRRRSRPPTGSDDAGDALSLVEARSRPSQSGLDLRTEMHERFALGDFTAALSSAELILGRDPDDAEAIEVSTESRERLAGLYVSRLGDRRAIPHPVPDVDVRWLGLDHRAAYLLSRIDGSTTVQALVDLAGMPELEVLRTCVELLDAGAIRMDG